VREEAGWNLLLGAQAYDSKTDWCLDPMIILLLEKGSTLHGQYLPVSNKLVFPQYQTAARYSGPA
jgi:hypothetical protein